jgi:hypothetical protein
MLEVQTRTTITAMHVTADDWELYDRPGREEAAARINAAIVDAVNNNERPIAVTLCRAALDAESEFGASDTEGVSTLAWILQQVYKGKQ